MVEIPPSLPKRYRIRVSSLFVGPLSLDNARMFLLRRKPREKHVFGQQAMIYIANCLHLGAAAPEASVKRKGRRRLAPAPPMTPPEASAPTG